MEKKNKVPASNRVVYCGHNTDFWPGPPEDFEKKYTLIKSRTYVLGNQFPQKIFFGERKPRQCAFCGGAEGEADVSFRSEAHLFPAALGNREIFSNEECDECNKRFGQECESQLAKMLAPNLAMSGVPGRKGVPKLMHPQGEGYVGGGPARTIVIGTSEADPTVKVSLDEESKVLEVSTFAPRFYPVRALQSLIRSAWLLLDPAERSDFSLVGELAAGKERILPFLYGQGFIPGADSTSGEFKIWKATEHDIPPLLVQYRIGSIMLLWGSPSPKTRTYGPFPLPYWEAHEDAPGPSITVRKILADRILDRTVSKFTCHFENLVKNPGTRPEARPVQSSKKSERVTLEAINGSKAAAIKGAYATFRNQAHGFSVNFGGGPLAAKVRMVFDENRVAKELQFDPMFHSKPPSEAANTLRFIKLLTRGGSKIRVRSNDGKELFEAVVEGLVVPPNLKDDLQLLEALDTLNSVYGARLQLPKSVPDYEWLLARVLAAACEGKPVRFKPVQSTQEAILAYGDDEALARILAGKDVAYSVTGKVELFGCPVDPGPRQVVYVRPALAAGEDAEQVRRLLAELKPSELLRFEVTVDEIVWCPIACG